MERNLVRIFALSDIHVDFGVNSAWVTGLSTQDYKDDVLILAGDVSDSLARLERCLTEFSRRFAKVLYVPGNHDLWVSRDKDIADSMAKFDAVMALAENCGVQTRAFHAPGLSIAPLFGWYDYSFGAPTRQLHTFWMDFQQCRWRPGWSAADITQAFLTMNDNPIEARDALVISFSHFLPRIDLMPQYIPEQHKVLYPILGASGLDAQVRAIGSRLHVYGHSHVNRRIRLDGVEYVNNAYGYPRETRITSKSLLCIGGSALAGWGIGQAPGQAPGDMCPASE